MPGDLTGLAADRARFFYMNRASDGELLDSQARAILVLLVLQQQQPDLFYLWKLNSSGNSIFRYMPCPVSLLNFTETHETLQSSMKLF